MCVYMYVCIYIYIYILYTHGRRWQQRRGRGPVSPLHDRDTLGVPVRFLEMRLVRRPPPLWDTPNRELE